MPQPAEVDRLSEQLRALYALAQEQLDAEQEFLAGDPARWRASRRVRDLRSTVDTLMDHLDGQARQWVANDFPKAYSLAAATAARSVGEGFGWTQPHLDAVTVLAQDLFDDLLKASTGVRRSTRLLIGRLAREAATASVVGGKTAVQGGKLMADLAEGRGIWSVRYKDGSLHGIGEYSEMVVRTKTAVAYSVGSVKGAPDVKFFECFDGTGCGWTAHEDPEAANGKIVTSDEALSWPVAHPRCRRSFGARPDLLTEADASAAKPSTTPEQQADQAAAEEARRATQARRAVLRQREAVLARRQERLARR